MIIDLHIHTNRYSSCSRLSPYELVTSAQKKGLDGIAITEHNIVWSEDEIMELKKYIHLENFVILRGQEIRTRTDKTSGDVLVFGFNDILKKKFTPKELINLVHQNGGIVIAAHPYRPYLGLAEEVYNLNLDAIEVLNSNNIKDEEQMAQKASELLDIAATGGSDAHSPEVVGCYATHFEDKIKTEIDLIKAIKGKRCRPIIS
ncbi:MAG: PHP domain-containing protein [bacterium]